MTLLSLNHGAKGILMWVFPTADEIVGVASKFSQVVLARDGLSTFVLMAHAAVVPVPGVENVDAAMWRVGSRMMVTVVNAGKEKIEGEVKLEFGDDAKIKGLNRNLWGRGGWKIESQNAAVRDGMDAQGSWVFVVDVDGEDNDVATSRYEER